MITTRILILLLGLAVVFAAPVTEDAVEDQEALAPPEDAIVPEAPPELGAWWFKKFRKKLSSDWHHAKKKKGLASKTLTLDQAIAKYGACPIKNADLHFQAVGTNALMGDELLYRTTILASKNDGLGQKPDGTPYKRIQHVLLYFRFEKECAGTPGIVVAHDQNIDVVTIADAEATESKMSHQKEYNHLTYHGRPIIPYEHGNYLPAPVAANRVRKFGCVIHDLLESYKHLETYKLFKQNCADFARELFFAYLYGDKWIHNGKLNKKKMDHLVKKGMSEYRLKERMQNSEIMEKAMYKVCEERTTCGGKLRINLDLKIIGAASNSAFTDGKITGAMTKKAAQFCS